MRDAIAILASSSITFPRNSTPTTSHHQHLSPTTQPKPKKLAGRKQSLNSVASLLHRSTHSTVRWDTTSASRNLQRLKDYAGLASNLAEDGRFHDFLMIAESVVVSGAKPSHFLALLNVNIVSAGICIIIRLCMKKRSPSAANRYAQMFPQVDTLLCTIMIESGKKRDLVSALTVFEASQKNQGYPNSNRCLWPPW